MPEAGAVETEAALEGGRRLKNSLSGQEQLQHALSPLEGAGALPSHSG